MSWRVESYIYCIFFNEDAFKNSVMIGGTNSKFKFVLRQVDSGWPTKYEMHNI